MKAGRERYGHGASSVRTGEMKRAFLLAVLLLAARADGASVWWDKSYKARREVTVYAPGTSTGGDDVAVVSFHTAGHLREDGADIRVVRRGIDTPYKLYGLGPGDKVTLAFKVDRSTRDYHIYFGNPDAVQLSYGWDPQRGLILETPGFQGGNPSNLARMRRIWRESKPFYGAGEVTKVWHGHNVFGPSNRFVSRYVGEIVCGIAGRYMSMENGPGVVA